MRCYRLIPEMSLLSNKGSPVNQTKSDGLSKSMDLSGGCRPGNSMPRTDANGTTGCRVHYLLVLDVLLGMQFVCFQFVWHGEIAHVLLTLHAIFRYCFFLTQHPPSARANSAPPTDFYSNLFSLVSSWRQQLAAGPSKAHGSTAVSKTAIISRKRPRVQ